MSNTYTMGFECDNCGKDGSIEIPRGELVGSEKRECPNCGCKSAKVKNPKTRDNLDEVMDELKKVEPYRYIPPWPYYPPSDPFFKYEKHPDEPKPWVWLDGGTGSPPPYRTGTTSLIGGHQ